MNSTPKQITINSSQPTTKAVVAENLAERLRNSLIAYLFGQLQVVGKKRFVAGLPDFQVPQFSGVSQWLQGARVHAQKSQRSASAQALLALAAVVLLVLPAHSQGAHRFRVLTDGCDFRCPGLCAIVDDLNCLAAPQTIRERVTAPREQLGQRVAPGNEAFAQAHGMSASGESAAVVTNPVNTVGVAPPPQIGPHRYQSFADAVSKGPIGSERLAPERIVIDLDINALNRDQVRDFFSIAKERVEAIDATRKKGTDAVFYRRGFRGGRRNINPPQVGIPSGEYILKCPAAVGQQFSGAWRINGQCLALLHSDKQRGAQEHVAWNVRPEVVGNIEPQIKAVN